MSDDTDSSPQFWLMTGPTPAGPFTAANIHARMADGSLPPSTPACPVGGSEWVPLAEMPGFGPSRDARPLEPTRPPVAAGSVDDDRRAAVVGFGGLAVVLGLLVAIGYGVYEWVRPLTAREVCDRVIASDTPDDAAPYVTPRFRAFAEAEFDGTPVSVPDDAFELVGETAGPNAETRHVGFRMEVYMPEAGRRVRMAGYIRVIQTDGWKVDDMIVTTTDGVPLERSVSLVDEHVQTGAAAARPPAAPPAQGLVAWYDGLNPRTKRYLAIAAILAVGGAARAAWAARTSAASEGTTPRA